MQEFSWQLGNPIDAVIFDCDGTLSQIEGIDELALQSGVGPSVKLLTEEAMSTTGLTPNLYKERLELVRPSLSQVIELGTTYYERVMEDAVDVIKIFKHFHKPVFLISAGLFPAVHIFGEKLGINTQHIFAVNINFTPEGEYLDYDANSSLVHNTGKRQIISELLTKYPRAVYIGDGLNDLSAADLVTRFVGYGGITYRENIAERCEFYITCPTLAPLLTLSLTEEEAKKLTQSDQETYLKGLRAIQANLVKV